MKIIYNLVKYTFNIKATIFIHLFHKTSCRFVNCCLNIGITGSNYLLVIIFSTISENEVK